MDDVLKFGTEDGPGKFIFKADELNPLDANNPLKFKKDREKWTNKWIIKIRRYVYEGSNI